MEGVHSQHNPLLVALLSQLHEPPCPRASTANQKAQGVVLGRGGHAEGVPVQPGNLRDLYAHPLPRLKLLELGGAKHLQLEHVAAAGHGREALGGEQGLAQRVQEGGPLGGGVEREAGHQVERHLVPVHDRKHEGQGSARHVRAPEEAVEAAAHPLQRRNPEQIESQQSHQPAKVGPVVVAGALAFPALFRLGHLVGGPARGRGQHDVEVPRSHAVQ
mmetsp:Transcript_25611/g.48495  ORF Transcript_25611/g.48495 Transcript_25611/m.48495 type:complete len:217 (-) Transcript_25611:711-1361(-)